MVITELFCVFKSDKQIVTKLTTMITKDKVTEIFCIIDEFDKNFDLELKKNYILIVKYQININMIVITQSGCIKRNLTI